MKRFFFITIAWLIFSNTLFSQKEISWQNPIIHKDSPDPYIIYENGFYYLFHTGKGQDGRVIPIYKSDNLTDWSFIRGAAAKGNKTDWNYKNFWAPEVIRYHGKFYLYFTASPDTSFKNTGNRVGVAVSDHVEGPYECLSVVIDHASIDGHPFFDTDSTLYMFFTIEHGNSRGLKAGQIYMDKMISPLKASGNPVPVITHHKWQEGPCLKNINGKYFLTYSCGSWTNETYHLRYAVSNNVSGPYTEMPDTLLRSNEMVKGPGHHALFTDQNGNDWIVYHGWDTAHTGRYSRIDRIYFKSENFFINGPSFTAQKHSR